MSKTKNSIRFDEVLATDALAWTLFGMAQRGGFLYTAVGEGFCDRPAKPKDRQAVLRLLVLFDKAVVKDLTPNETPWLKPAKRVVIRSLEESQASVNNPRSPLLARRLWRFCW